MKLSQWAKQQGLSYTTCYRAFKNGHIPNAYQLASGTIIVPDVVNSTKQEHNVVYARVNSPMNKDNLKSQSKRLVEYCNAKGMVVHEVVEECASGLNDKRPKLLKILTEQKATSIIIEHKDRLTRFGFNYLTTLLRDCKIICLNEDKEQDADLMSDFISLVTCFCARLYGRRRSHRKTEQLIRELQEEK